MNIFCRLSDYIISVNGQSLQNLSEDTINYFLCRIPRGPVTVTVRSCKLNWKETLTLSPFESPTRSLPLSKTDTCRAPPDGRDKDEHEEDYVGLSRNLSKSMDLNCLPRPNCQSEAVGGYDRLQYTSNILNISAKNNRPQAVKVDSFMKKLPNATSLHTKVSTATS